MKIQDKNYGSNPNDCHYCRWWDTLRKRCGKHSGGCVFDEKMSPEDTRVKRTPCDGCPYGVGRVCIGWCMRKLTGEGAA